jgi:hypothetical protein
MKLFVSFLTAAALLLSFTSQPLMAKDDKGKKRKSKTQADENAPKFNVPIPPGHSAEGLTIPYYDDKGKLQMNFKIETASRTDNDHLQMVAVKIETYDEKGQPEMSIDMPKSVLDLNTRIVTSDVPVTIRRSDFEVTGDTMTFNTETRNGHMVGKVRMLIYNHDEMSKPADKPADEPHE